MEFRLKSTKENSWACWRIRLRKNNHGRCILRLIDPTSGNVTFNYDDFLKLEGEDLLNARQKMQAIFQIRIHH
jgi:hypothetical protein